MRNAECGMRIRTHGTHGKLLYLKNLHAATRRAWLKLVLRVACGALCLASVLACFVTPARADLKIRLRNMADDKSVTETILYFKGVRQRNDLARLEKDKRAPLGTIIFQCDQNLYLWLDEKERNFWHTPYESPDLLAPIPENPLTSLPRDDKKKAGGVVNETYSVLDTGERREFHGYTARHIKTSRVWEAAPSCRQTPLRQETDGWYIDLLYGFGCSPNLSGIHQRGATYAATNCLSRYRQRHYEFTRTQKGSARLGFPLNETRKTYDDKNRASLSVWEIVEFSDADLDLALFQAPEKYKEIPAPGTERSLISRLLALLPWR